MLELLIQEEIWDEADILRFRNAQRQVSFAKAKMRRMRSVEAGGRGHGPLSPDTHSVVRACFRALIFLLIYPNGNV